MDENMLRFLMMAGFIALALAIAAVSGELSSYGLSDPLENLYPVLEYDNITRLIEDMPLGKDVSLSGTVSRVADDFTSDSGHEYQQFYVSDGQSEVKVFCSKHHGTADVRGGDRVFLLGRFQKYYNIPEISTGCSDVNII